MLNTVQYIVDDNGKKTSVLVPVKVWEELHENYQKLQKKVEILNGVNEGFHEVKQARRAGKKLQTLTNFLK